MSRYAPETTYPNLMLQRSYGGPLRRWPTAEKVAPPEELDLKTRMRKAATRLRSRLTGQKVEKSVEQFGKYFVEIDHRRRWFKKLRPNYLEFAEIPVPVAHRTEELAEPTITVKVDGADKARIAVYESYFPQGKNRARMRLVSYGTARELNRRGTALKAATQVRS